MRKRYALWSIACAGTVAWFVVSRYVCVWIGGSSWMAEFANGGVIINYNIARGMRYIDAFGNPWRLGIVGIDAVQSQRMIWWFGDNAFRLPVVMVPLWPLCVLVLGSWLAFVMRRRTRVGSCRECGYDLRGDREFIGGGTVRCPECGVEQ